MYTFQLCEFLVYVEIQLPQASELRSVSNFMYRFNIKIYYFLFEVYIHIFVPHLTQVHEHIYSYTLFTIECTRTVMFILIMN